VLAGSPGPVPDDIAPQSFTFGNSVRALGALSRMKDQASQQRAILYTALAAGQFSPSEVTALTAAEAEQASDLASFNASAALPRRQLFTRTVDGAPTGQAQALEQVAVANTNNGTALLLGPTTSRAGTHRPAC
jgi:Nitrate and nitrite sensing